MVAQGCAVRSNSTQSVAMEGTGSGSATASIFCAADDVLGGSINFSVPPQSNCPAVEDPLVDSTILIANTVEFIGAAEVSIRSDFAASDIPVPTAILQGRIMPRLIE